MKLKTIIFTTTLLILACINSNAQKLYSSEMPGINKDLPCPKFDLDLAKGTLNGLKVNSGPDEFTSKFPCISGYIDGWYQNVDSYFVLEGYPGFIIDFKSEVIEIGKSFKGKTSQNILGKTRKKVDSKLGKAAKSGEFYDAYKMPYGTLMVYYDGIFLNPSTIKKRKVERITIHYTSVNETIEKYCNDPEYCR